MLLFYLTGSGNHRSKFLRNIVDHVREKFLCHHGPGRTAGGQKKRKVSGSNFLCIVVRLGNSSDICSQSNLVHIGKTKDLKGSFKFTWCYVFSELTDISRSHNGNDLISFTQRVGKLENLRFVRNGSKRTAYHTHTAGNTFVIQDFCTSLFVASDGLYAAGLFAWTDIVRDGIIRTYGFTFSAFDTFILINTGFAIDHGNGALGTGLHTWVSHTASAHVADNIFVGRAGRTGRRNYLHKGRFIIFFINIAGFQS